ncbi:MAG: SCO family protein [Ignavibacterium sp.]|nr:SCO family protein [Ignavibacterium sp.]MDW8374077.1 SCO family protein [Ignavibacteriales bacterium]
MFFVFFIAYSCYEHFPLKQDITRTQNKFLTQDSILVEFPKIIQGKVTLVTMIYTNCPDICPMTTHNMQMVFDSLKDDIKDQVRLVVITFDPERDLPYVLKDYAVIRNYDLSKWYFLTSDQIQTNEVMLKFGIKAVKTDSSYDANGRLSYYITHTDRISLIDKDGFIRKNYKGSVINVEEIVKDISYLLN